MVVFKKEEEQNIDFRNLFKSLLKIYEVQNAKFTTYRIVGKFGGGEIWQTNRWAYRLLIVRTNLDDFSLANHGQFAKFAKFFPRQTLPLYGMIFALICTVIDLYNKN